jgi:hypothetical protein
MVDEYGAPDLRDALDGWLAARVETDRHLKPTGEPATREWIQLLSDLLATERAWQDQYTEVVGFGGIGRFPKPRR